MNCNLISGVFLMYTQMQILVICNNHEFDVLTNGSVKFVETSNKNSEDIHVKCKFVVTIEWNIM